jgi:hypothetical protein
MYKNNLKIWIAVGGVLALLLVVSIVVNVLLFRNGRRWESNVRQLTQGYMEDTNLNSAKLQECRSSLQTEKANGSESEETKNIFVGYKWPSGLLITDVGHNSYGDITSIIIQGDLKISGKYFTYPNEGDCAYSCGMTCFVAEQTLPLRQEFCFGDKNAIAKLGSDEGRAELVVKRLSVPYEGPMIGKVEGIKILK